MPNTGLDVTAGRPLPPAGVGIDGGSNSSGGESDTDGAERSSLLATRQQPTDGDRVRGGHRRWRAPGHDGRCHGWDHRTLGCLSVGAVIALVAGLAVALLHLWHPAGYSGGVGNMITREAFEHGMAMCEANDLKALENPLDYLTGTHANANGRPVHIRNATVWDGLGNVLPETDLVLSHGLIAKIGRSLSRADVAAAVSRAAQAVSDAAVASASSISDLLVIEAEGRVVSPGLVDQHSHVAVEPLPGLIGSADGNELSSMVNPQLRIVDSINVLDPGLDIVLSGGVTTSLVLPGSGILMGGEALAIKMIRTETNEPEDLGVNRGMDPRGTDGKTWRWMKMACGENPKRVGPMLGQMPTSRMGTGWLFRRQFEAARDLVRRQEDWCEGARLTKRLHGESSHRYIHGRYPEELVHESLAALLRGDVRLQVHCYDPQDIEMMVRNKHEFGFNITTFHHATEAFLVAPLLARENISAAIFSEFSIYKAEAYEHSVRAGKIFAEAGVPFAYKSDHPALNAQNLIYEAQRGVHHGVDPNLAFMAVTSVPAERIGLGWRIGRIAEAYDADVVIWDRPPLEIGANPLHVFVDGFTAFSKSFKPPRSQNAVPVPPVTPVLDSPASFSAYTIANVSAIYAGPEVVSSGYIVVKDGNVFCVGPTCKPEGEVFNNNGGVVIPGMIAANTPIGLTDIEQESSTHDGSVSSENALSGLAHAADGLRVGGDQKHLQYAFRHGVLTAITPPEHNGLIGGFSVAFRTGAEDSWTNSLTVQIGRLRELLSDAGSSSPFSHVVSGELPLVVDANEPSDISKVLGIASAHPSLRLVVAGAAGAWKVASELAATANASVLLQPGRCLPLTWETRSCLPPHSRPTAAERLRAAGVERLAISVPKEVPGPDQVRSLRFEAGWLAADAVELGLGRLGPSGNGRLELSAEAESEAVAIGAVTWTVADAFGLTELGVGRIVQGTRANLVALDATPGNALSLSASVQLLGDGRSIVTLPRQD
ncbi:hypothetical protein HK405_014354 [Cladochytrium tenue]|nr:hypothetical protein HK405_014354 [Cladochytrium tenue]